MRIALINNLYPPEGRGGAEYVARKMAKDLLREGNEVIVIAGSKQDKREYFQNYKIIRFKPFNIYFLTDASKHSFSMRLLWQFINMFNLASYWQLRKILKRERPKLIIAHNLMGLGFLAPSLFKALNIKYIQYLHDIQLSVPSGILLKGEENKWLNKGLAQKIYEKTCKSLFITPDEVITPSKWLMDFYEARGFFKRSKRTIKGIDWQKYNLPAIKDKLNNFKDKIEAREKVNCLYVGKIEEHKGILWLAEAWKKMPANLYLTIIGDGEETNKLNDIIKGLSNVSYLGREDKDELTKEYSKADVLIMPTLCYENRPEVILKAYQNNLSVIASNLGGIPEIIRAGETGYLFEAGSEENFKKAILL